MNTRTIEEEVNSAIQLFCKHKDVLGLLSLCCKNKTITGQNVVMMGQQFCQRLPPGTLLRLWFSNCTFDAQGIAHLTSKKCFGELIVDSIDCCWCQNSSISHEDLSGMVKGLREFSFRMKNDSGVSLIMRNGECLEELHVLANIGGSSSIETRHLQDLFQSLGSLPKLQVFRLDAYECNDKDLAFLVDGVLRLDKLKRLCLCLRWSTMTSQSLSTLTAFLEGVAKNCTKNSELSIHPCPGLFVDATPVELDLFAQALGRASVSLWLENVGINPLQMCHLLRGLEGGVFDDEFTSLVVISGDGIFNTSTTEQLVCSLPKITKFDYLSLTDFNRADWDKKNDKRLVSALANNARIVFVDMRVGDLKKDRLRANPENKNRTECILNRNKTIRQVVQKWTLPSKKQQLQVLAPRVVAPTVACLPRAIARVARRSKQFEADPVYLLLRHEAVNLWISGAAARTEETEADLCRRGSEPDCFPLLQWLFPARR